MKILIAYHSFWNNTEKLAKAIQEEFIKKGHTVDIEKIEPAQKKDPGYWFIRRIFQGECDIKPPRIKDVSSYDIICFGSPNWTRISLPMARYITTVKGLQYKKIGFFASTALPPLFEWFVFSAYLLDLSCSVIIEKLKGRLIDTLLISSVFKSLSIDSAWGKEKIAGFCKNLVTPIRSYKEYVLEQKEKDETRLQIVVLIFILFISPFIYLLLSAFSELQLSWVQYLALLSMGIINLVILLDLMGTRKYISLGKYITAVTYISIWTLLVLFVDPALEKEILTGYILIISSMGFFRQPKTVWFAGAISLLGYTLLMYHDFQEPQLKNLLVPQLDLTFILVCTLITAIISQNIRHNYLILLDFQQELEAARMDLETKLTELRSAWTAVKKEHQKTDAIIANLVDGLLIFDMQGNLVLMNPAARMVLDCKDACSLEKVTGKNADELKHIPGFDKLVEIINHPNEKSELLLDNKHVIEVTISKAEDTSETSGDAKDKREMRLVLLHDVTERRKLEEMKINFASIAAHELRTPITVIEGYLSILTDEHGGLSDEEKINCLKKACKASRKLSTLIESLLVVTRVEQGRELLHNEPVDVPEFINEVVQEVAPEIKAKEQTIDVSLPDSPIPQITVDKLKTKEILSNLLTNANRYTQKNGHIKISAGVKDNYLEIHIEDNGQGIPEVIQPFLFTKFTRAENAIRKETKGVGLGLYLVKSLVELQGGKVWFTSKPEKGSTFSFRLPYQTNSDIN